MNPWMERIRAWARLRPSIWAWAVAALLAGFLAYYWDATAPRADAAPEAPEDVTTVIPSGFVLVPIEIANYESLDSILGKFGVVDLYAPSEDPRKKPRRVAEKVKILRAPLNPSRFAVLARESESARLVTYSGPLTAVVQNPKLGAGTGIVNPTEAESRAPASPKHSRITVEVMNDP